MLLCDDSFASVPISKVGKKMSASDVKYQHYSSHREFECLEFENGYSYLLLNRGPEVLRSTRQYYKNRVRFRGLI